MSTKLTSAGTMKEGSNIVLEGAACRVTSVQISRPGKHGHAKIRIEAVGMLDDKKRVVVMPGHDNVEVPLIDKRNAQVLSVHGDMANLMDSETYETFDLKVPDELKDSVVEGVQIIYWNILNDRIMKQVKSSSGE